ncbi:MAG: hypothetical protein ACXVEF_08335 [Polyangiales bacterium]
MGRRAFLHRSALLGAGAAAVLAGCRKEPPFPPEDVPEGAYARIAVALYDARYRDVFPYLEDEAQWAAHTIQKEREKALDRAKRSFPPGELAVLEADIGVDARSADGADVFVRFAKKKGWFNRLRQDLSGVARVERDGDRATVVTARGTRYPMRRRTVGIWGLTAFTADLADAAEKATRDRARIEDAARDYDAAKPKAVLTGDSGAPG